MSLVEECGAKIRQTAEGELAEVLASTLQAIGQLTAAADLLEGALAETGSQAAAGSAAGVAAGRSNLDGTIHSVRTAQAELDAYLTAIGLPGVALPPLKSPPESTPPPAARAEAAYKDLIKHGPEKPINSMAHALGSFVVPTSDEMELLKAAIPPSEIIISTNDRLIREYFEPREADILMRTVTSFRETIWRNRLRCGYGEILGSITLKVGYHSPALNTSDTEWHIDTVSTRPKEQALFVGRAGEAGSTEFAIGPYYTHQVDDEGTLMDATLVGPNGPLRPVTHGHGMVSLFYNFLTIHRASLQPGFQVFLRARAANR